MFPINSLVIVHVSHADKNIELTNDSISFIFNFSCSDLSFYIIFILDKAATACPVLALF